MRMELCRADASDSKEEKIMSNEKGFNRRSLPGRAAIVALWIVGMCGARAADPECFNLASLQGQYTLVTNYGDNVARALVVRYYDGNGKFTGSFIINLPKAGSTTGERTIVTGTQNGTYTMNCEGTGVVTRVVTLSDGSTVNEKEDFIITAAEVHQNGHGPFFPGKLLATALEDAGRDPSPIVAGGVFVTHTYSRLPDRQLPQR